MQYFISDMHFDDANILVYEHRPFSCVEEMNETIIHNINTVVKNSDDILTIGGDVGNPEYLKYLKCHFEIVKGNHDNLKVLKAMYPDVFISPYPIYKDGCWISHEPITFMPAECPYLNIHGHLHHLIYGTEDRTWKGGCRYFNTSVERTNYMPISKTEIAKIIKFM